MSSRTDKENPSVNRSAARGARSKIPIMAASTELTNKLKSDKFVSVLGERQPLQNIQAATGGGMTHADFQLKKRKISSVSKVVGYAVYGTRHLSPKGSVNKLTNNIKTTTTLQNETKHKSLQDRMKNVTLRNRKESPLDWDLEVFKDYGTEERFATTSNQAMLITKKQKEQRSKSAERPSRIPKPLTPTLIPTAQHNRVKNIKRSLKRPSSREIQNRASSEADMQLEAAPMLQHDRALRVLEFDPIDCPDQEVLKQTQKLTQCYERRIINYLLLMGQQLRSPPRICPLQRSIVVNWLVKISGIQTPQTLQVTVRHLDRVLALNPVPIEKVQLLAAACFWLAQKQCAKPKPATSFARHAAHAFSPIDLRAAERYVLRRLNWPQIPVVADDFVPYLVQQCSPDRPEPLTSAATFLCTAALLDADLSACPPDLLALAAVVNCALLLPEAGNIDSLHLSPLYRAACVSGRLHDVRLQLLRTVLVMREDNCPCREPYVQHSRAPHDVAPRLAAGVLAARAARRANLEIQ